MSRKRTVGQFNLFEFSPPVDDPPEIGGPALWGYQGGNIRAWDENGTQIVNAPWPDSAPPVVFIEGKPEGETRWLYSVHGTTGATNAVKRWRVAGGTAIVGLTTLVSGTGIPTGRCLACASALEGAGQHQMLAAPDGTIFIKAAGEATAFGASDRGVHSWYKLVQSGGTWSLVLEIDTPKPVTDYMVLVSGSIAAGEDPGCDLIGYYCTRHWSSTMGAGYTGFGNEVNRWSRGFKETILKAGRWVAADPIPYTLSEQRLTGPCGGGSGSAVTTANMELEGPEVNDRCMVNNLSGLDCGAVPADDPSRFVSATVRVWGDAWWQRNAGDAAWTGVANTGLSTTTKSVAVEISGPCGQFWQAPNPTSAFVTTRNAQWTGVLPALTFRRGLELQEFTPSTQVKNQNVVMMRADGTDLYIFVIGGSDFVSGAYVPGGIWRSPVPAAGGAPAWSSLLTEPNLQTTNDAWNELELTDNYLWLTESDFGGGAGGTDQTHLVRYNKDGTGRVIKQTFGVHSSGLSLQVGWDHRWK